MRKSVHCVSCLWHLSWKCSSRILKLTYLMENCLASWLRSSLTSLTLIAYHLWNILLNKHRGFRLCTGRISDFLPLECNFAKVICIHFKKKNKTTVCLLAFDLIGIAFLLWEVVKNSALLLFFFKSTSFDFLLCHSVEVYL